MHFLVTLKSGLEDMIKAEKSKLAELTGVRDRMGGK